MTCSVTESAIEQSERSRSEAWKRAALAGVYAVAQQRPTLIVEDVRSYLGEEFLGDSPHALGPVMRTAAKEGVVKLTSATAISTLPMQHKRLVRVWQSLIYQED